MGSFFVHGALAWAAVALVSVPIIIHLIHRRRFRRIDWATMEFLLRAVKRNRRRVRLEQLLLLLVRMALMLLLGLALARPMLSDSGPWWLSGALRSEEKAFVVDDSFSTSVRQGGRTVLTRAAEALSGALDELSERGGDRVTVLQGSRPRAPLVRRQILDPERAGALGRRLTSLTPTDGRLLLADALELLAGAATESSDEGVRRPLAVTILSDLRASDWTASETVDAASATPDPALADALERLRADEAAPATIVVLDAAGPESENVAITSVGIAGGRAVAGLPAEFLVTLRNLGPAPARDLQLGASYRPAAAADDGAPSPLVDVAGPPLEPLAPGETRTAAIACSFLGTGPHAVTIKVTGAADRLPDDDSFPIAVDVVEAIDVLLVSGEPSGEPFEGETDFLELALAPAGDQGSGIRPEVVSEDSLPQGSLKKYGAIFLCNLYTVPDDFVVRLRRYVDGGGALVVFLGDQTDRALLHRALGVGRDDAATEPLAAATIGELANAGLDYAHLAPDLDHAYFRSLRDVEEAFARVSFARWFKLEPLPNSRVIARFTGLGGTPAIVERPFGEGRVIQFASAADLEWSDWPRNPTFLVLLQDLVASIVRRPDVVSDTLAGHPLEIPVDVAKYAIRARVRPPGWPAAAERTLSAAPSPDDPSQLRFVVADTRVSGHYAIALRTKSGEEEWRLFAVRRDPRESQLARVSEADLRRLYPEAELTVVRDASGFADVGKGRFEIADLLLWLIPFLLFAEALMAWKFAHHAQNGAGARPTAGGRA